MTVRRHGTSRPTVCAREWIVAGIGARPGAAQGAGAFGAADRTVRWSLARLGAAGAPPWPARVAGRWTAWVRRRAGCRGRARWCSHLVLRRPGPAGAGIGLPPIDPGALARAVARNATRPERGDAFDAQTRAPDPRGQASDTAPARESAATKPCAAGVYAASLPARGATPGRDGGEGDERTDRLVGTKRLRPATPGAVSARDASHSPHACRPADDFSRSTPQSARPGAGESGPRSIGKARPATAIASPPHRWPHARSTRAAMGQAPGRSPC